MDQAKGTQEATDQPTKQGPEKEDNPQDIVGKGVLVRPHNCLEGPNRAGPVGPGARIAIHPWDTKVLAGTLVNGSSDKAGKVTIGGQGKKPLDPVADFF